MSKCETLKFIFYNKDGHISMFCFIKKSHKSKDGHPPSYFYKDHCEPKNRKVSAHKIYSTNIKGPEKY